MSRTFTSGPAAGGRPAPSLLEQVAAIQLDAYPQDDPAHAVDTVRGWGEQLRRRLAPDMASVHRLRMLHHFFFDELGFSGNVDTYDDPDNSYLNRVIDRRTGIPISLSLVYCEIGAAIGLRLAGVGFPGHFLVKVVISEGSLLVDVFGRGAMLSTAELRRRLHAALAGEPARPLEDYLQAAAEADILVRWLRNLKAIHLAARNWEQLLKVTNRLLDAAPRTVEEHLARALAYEHLDCPRAAVEDLTVVLALRPAAADAAALRGRLQRLQRAAGALH
jgi:regulator of sirC expression with transglutaminase-like and TPR domain